jgi:thiaminase/transcriptional activator TenA
VRGLADGTLAPEIFRGYVAQDSFYLQAFARAYAVAAARSPDMETYGSLLDLMRGALEELTLHAAYAEELAIDLDVVSPLPVTLAYTDFLLATAWSRGFAETIAAMAPCMRLYAWLGAELAKDGVPDHRNARWIRTYSSDDMQDLADLLDGMLDRHAGHTPAVASAYRQGMDLEFAFFEACFSAERLSG